MDQQHIIETFNTFMDGFNDTMEKEGSGKWIQKANLKKGALHRELGVPAGEKIPESKLKAAEKNKTKSGKETVLARRARLADMLKKFKGKR